MRWAVLATAGLAFWLCAGFVFTSPATFAGGQSIFVYAYWLLRHGGAALALGGVYGLARTLRGAFHQRAVVDGGREHGAKPELPFILLAAGVALAAVAEARGLLAYGDGFPSAPLDLILLASHFASPLFMTIGVFLGLRRLADLAAPQSLGPMGDEDSGQAS